MRRAHGRLYGTAWFIFVMILLSSMFTASYYLTAYLYQLIHLHLSLLLAQIINSLSGLLFAGLIGSGAIKIANSLGWLPERNVFNPIVEALGKIAKAISACGWTAPTRITRWWGCWPNSINNMALELEQMENLRQEFISNVSHEIQSPLTSIGGFAQALQNDQLSAEERHHYLAIIETERPAGVEDH